MELSLDEIETALNDSDASDDQIEVTSAELIQIMEEAWINEKYAPEILPHKSEVVDCLLAQITAMEENLQNISNSDFKKSIHQLEVDRLRFLVSSYLRTRLEKIEAYVTHTLQEERQRSQRNEESYLSEQELQFATEYSRGLENYFNDLTKFYPGLPTEDWCNQMIKPNIHSFVFLKSKKEVEGVVLDDGNEEGDNDLVDFRPGSQMIISYNSISRLLKDGDVHLI